MKKSIAIDDRFFYRDDILYLSAIREAGFDAIDYSVGWGALLGEGCEDKIEKVRQKLEETGIECYQIHLPCARCPRYPWNALQPILPRASLPPRRNGVCSSRSFRR